MDQLLLNILFGGSIRTDQCLKHIPNHLSIHPSHQPSPGRLRVCGDKQNNVERKLRDPDSVHYIITPIILENDLRGKSLPQREMCLKKSPRQGVWQICIATATTTGIHQRFTQGQRYGNQWALLLEKIKVGNKSRMRLQFTHFFCVSDEEKTFTRRDILSTPIRIQGRACFWPQYTEICIFSNASDKAISAVASVWAVYTEGHSLLYLYDMSLYNMLALC